MEEHTHTHARAGVVLVLYLSLTFLLLFCFSSGFRYCSDRSVSGEIQAGSSVQYLNDSGNFDLLIIPAHSLFLFFFQLDLITDY